MAIWYIDPTISAAQESDSFDGGRGNGKLRNSWSDVTWASGDRYFQKVNTTWASRIVIGADNVLVSAYGGAGYAYNNVAYGADHNVLMFGRTGVVLERHIGLCAKIAAFQCSSTGTRNTVRDCKGFEFVSYGAFMRGQTDSKVIGCEFSSLHGVFNTGIHFDASTGGSGGLIIGNTVHDLKGDGIICRQGQNGVVIMGNRLYGAIKDAMALEDAHSCKVYLNTVRQDGVYGATYPAIKLGDNFGAGSPSDLNDIRGNIFFTREEVPLAANTAGTGNTIDYNLYYYTGSPTHIANWRDGTETIVPATLAEMQSIGYDLNSVVADPLLTADARTQVGSPAYGAGVYIRGAKHFGGHSMSAVSPDIGAYRYFAPRVSRAA